MNGGQRLTTDPIVYQTHNQQFESAGLPNDAAGWLERAHAVASILGKDAAARDRENKCPRAEIALLKASGLLKALGPTEFGGGGQPWSVGYQLIRAVAAGDGSIGMLLGYHLLWSTTANVVGTSDQARAVQEAIMRENWFVGGAVNPRDSDLSIRPDGNSVVFDGFKNFNTGGVVSDLTVLEGVLEGTDQHIFTFIKTDQEGLQFQHNWDNVGMRLTESGSVRISQIRVPWSDALGWDEQTHKPVDDVLGVPFATMLLPTIQLIFSNMYLGIAQGALKAALAYTRSSTRAWPYGGGKGGPVGGTGDNTAEAADEFYILERYGDFVAHVRAAEAVCDVAGAEITRLYTDAEVGVSEHHAANGYANGHANGATNGYANGDAKSGRSSISARRRGDVAALVAHAKVVTTDTGLRVTSGVFEMLGSRATGTKYGFDLYWRNIRTHTLHDPVAYKKREVGRYALLDEVPGPSWYT